MRNAPDGHDWKSSKVLERIEYNIDDCDSTQELTEWLSKDKENKLEFIPFDVSHDLKNTEKVVTSTTLLRDKSLSLAECTICRINEHLEKYGLILEFHKRENKPTWWRLYDRMGQNEFDLIDDMDCLIKPKNT